MTDIPETIAGFPRRAALAALENNLISLWRNFGMGPDCRLHETVETVFYETPIPTIPYNAVLRFAVSRDPESKVEEIIGRFRERQVPLFWVALPSSHPENLGQLLLERGLQLAEEIPGMVGDLRQLPEMPALPAGFTIREVHGEKEAGRVYELISWRWQVPETYLSLLKAMNRQFRVGMPDALARVWIAWQGEVPVAKAVLHLAEGAAGLYGVATRPEARGHGLATILTLKAFRAAREAGYSMGILHSSDMARSMYEKMGFRPVDVFRIYTSQDFHM